MTPTHTYDRIGRTGGSGGLVDRKGRTCSLHQIRVLLHAPRATCRDKFRPTIDQRRSNMLTPSKINLRPHRLRRLALAVVVSALSSAAYVSPAFAGGDNGDGSGPPRNMAPPTISGIPQEWGWLTTTYGSWSGADSYRIAWLRCDNAGSNCVLTATVSPVYGLGGYDVGHTLRAEVTASNSEGSNYARSLPTAVVTTYGR